MRESNKIKNIDISGNMKINRKVVYEISKNDKKILELIRVAKVIVLKEDEDLFRELAKH
ncbi:MAG: hypothetical protein AABW49_02770 [Nanoarchaeota archaeon]